MRGENEKSGSETRNDSRGALMRAHDYNKTARRVVHRAAAPAFSPFQRLPLVPRNGIPATVRRDSFAEAAVRGEFFSLFLCFILLKFVRILFLI